MIKNGRGHCIFWHKWLYSKHKIQFNVFTVRHRECVKCVRIEHEHFFSGYHWIEVLDCYVPINPPVGLLRQIDTNKD